MQLAIHNLELILCSFQPAIPDHGFLETHIPKQVQEDSPSRHSDKAPGQNPGLHVSAVNSGIKRQTQGAEERRRTQCTEERQWTQGWFRSCLIEMPAKREILEQVLVLGEHRIYRHTTKKGVLVPYLKEGSRRGALKSILCYAQITLASNLLCVFGFNDPGE